MSFKENLSSIALRNGKIDWKTRFSIMDMLIKTFDGWFVASRTEKNNTRRSEPLYYTSFTPARFVFYDFSAHRKWRRGRSRHAIPVFSAIFRPTGGACTRPPPPDAIFMGPRRDRPSRPGTRVKLFHYRSRLSDLENKRIALQKETRDL